MTSQSQSGFVDGKMAFGAITAPGKLAIHITRGLAVLLTFRDWTLSKKSSVSPSILRLRVRAANARHR